MGVGTIIVADGDRWICEMLGEFFATEGYRVTLANSADALFLALRRDRPHLVLLDADLPPAGGLPELPRLRRGHPALPVIVLSATPDLGVALESVARGAAACLFKPLDLDHLSRAVAAHIAPRRPASSRDNLLSRWAPEWVLSPTL